ncbi:MAG: Uma2 family endonuclease [Phototrophicaceae bacterium]
MAIPTKRILVEDFDEWILLAENTDKSFEYIGGEVYEVVSNNYASKIALEIGFHIKLFMRTHKVEGHLTGADGGYMVAGERYIPDIGYISAMRQANSSHDAYNPNHPDLAVEVISPTDSPQKITIKVGNYLAAGTVVWIVRPKEEQVEVFVSGQPVQILTHGDILDGGAVLRGFQLDVADIFPKK